MKILILSPSPSELKDVLDMFECKREYTVAGRQYYYACVGSVEYYLSWTSLGTTLAAANTTALCQTIHPDCIFLCGIAGGLKSDQDIGDLIIGGKVIDIDLMNLPSMIENSGYETFLTDAHSRQTICFEYDSDPFWLDQAKNVDIDHCHSGIIVTSNTFPLPIQLFDQIQQLSAEVIDMESFGVAQAARYFHIPVICVRAISNLINQEGEDTGMPDHAMSLCSQRLKAYFEALFQRLEHQKHQDHLDTEYQHIVKLLALQPHPEGGYYKRHYTAEEAVEVPERFAEPRQRARASSIFYLLPANSFSAWHKIQSDELWHHYQGDDVIIYILDEKTGQLSRRVLGKVSAQACPQVIVEHGLWFCAQPSGSVGYTLCGCSVAPEFDFSDFTLGTRQQLYQLFPQHRQMIKRFTRE